MWYVKIFALLIFVVAVLLFALANREQDVLLRWYPGAMGFPMNLAVGLAVSYFLGVLTFMMVAAIRELRVHRRCVRLEREAERMRRELDALRTAALEAPLGADSEQPEGSAPAGTPGRKQ
ncbi:MAG: hypothetical protein KAY24_09095 [Candidatus Eisenbacteria sp.]|nr:hypothetical protein [Candidatus Eisenbacteria bacterium]